MVKFSDEDKVVKEFNANRFGFGVHKVQIDGIIADDHEGKDYIEVSVLNPDNDEMTDNARFWFTGGAVNISFNELRRIYVHNAPEDKKAEAGATFDAVEDHTQIAELFAEKLIGGEAWFTVYYDAKGRTYVGSDGKTHRSINKNLVGYEPNLREDLMPDSQKSVSAGDFPAGDSSEPFGTDAEERAKKASDGIPPRGKW